MSIRDIAVGDAGPKGKGIFALRAFRKEEFIFRRRNGRVIANREVRSLSREDRMHLTELDYRTSAVVLPPGCYLNHACDPNAMRSGVKVFARWTIRPGDEITIDYRLNAFGRGRSRCVCRTKGCTGVLIGDFFALDPARQREYLPFAPAFVRTTYRERLRAQQRGANTTAAQRNRRFSSR